MRRKIILSVLSILILLCTVSLIYEKINKENKSSEGMFAIYLEKEKDTGKYEKSNLKTWPTEEEYAINMQKTYCENGSVLRWNLETKKINVTVKGTDKCYVYFDKAEYGSKEHPHLIQTIEDLVRLSNDVNSGTSYAGEYFLLTNDLDFKDPSDYEDSQRLDFLDINGINGNEALITELTTGSGFKPIGTSETSSIDNYFSGILLGNNKEIANLYINNTTKNYIGLFGLIKDGQINNLTITGNINSSRAVEAGGISGQGLNFIITNCQNKVNITVNAASQSVGGFLGSTGGISTIQNSQNYGNISNGNNTGGFLGTNDGTLTIQNSQNYGLITNDLGQHAGGLIGRDDDNTNKTTITNSSNEGMVKSMHYTGGLIGRAYGNIIINESYNSNTAEVIGNFAGGLIGYCNYITDIQNSYNNAKVIGENADPRAGGLISWSEGNKLNINESYNTGKITGQAANEGRSWVGGIVGQLSYTDTITNTITNSYNKGDVTGSFRTGGIIGLLYDSVLIMDKCFNTGNIVNTGNGISYAGGLIGATGLKNLYDLKFYALNSYNTGDVINQSSNADYTETASGLIGVNLTNNNYHIILFNSYNTGNVIADNIANGIIKNVHELVNTYNIGTITAEVSYGIGQILNSTTNVTNNYYLDNISNGSNLANASTAKTSDYINSQEFVDELNSNAFNIDLKTVDSSLAGYTLSLWKLGENGYPIFADDIKDLSGKGNNGLDFSVSKSSEGITTSDETNNGYINMGLANYDFGDSLSYVVRVKFNNLDKNLEFMGNWENAGGGFGIYKTGLIRFSQYVPEMDPNDYYRTGYSKTTIEVNKWYTIIGTYDGANIKIYINGEEEVSNPLTGKIKPSPTFIALGGNPAETNKVSNNSYTTFSDALVFDRALTKEEIAQNYYDVPNPINKDELLVWYKF